MTPGDAKRRTPVRLADGRTGRLIYWPVPVAERLTGGRASGSRRRGTKARVQIGPFVISVPTDQVVGVIEVHEGSTP